MAGSGWVQTVSEVYMAGSSRPIADGRSACLGGSYAAGEVIEPALGPLGAIWVTF